ncbi:hypothetical protein NE237_008870 [Protea cynaroides]|uniref:Uncharacterized protein n=1 Tax=Protea cynaroides TaxID=273540 RepID=A0A9Q0R066_9MAGN|nr:hypothetical protein NE237_008870 [Protea cynaroides]
MQPQTHHPLSCHSGCRHAAPPHPITKSTNPSENLHPLFPPNSVLLELTAVSRSSRTAWASGFSTPHLSPPFCRKASLLPPSKKPLAFQASNRTASSSPPSWNPCAVDRRYRFSFLTRVSTSDCEGYIIGIILVLFNV